jgi:hypothetical protein
MSADDSKEGGLWLLSVIRSQVFSVPTYNFASLESIRNPNIQQVVPWSPTKLEDQVSLMQRRHVLPFSRVEFKNILEVFNMPVATLEVLCSETSHFHQYMIGSEEPGSVGLGQTTPKPSQSSSNFLIK